MRYQGTDIDGPRIDPEGLMVRGMNLMELMGRHTFLETFFLALYDRLPTAGQLAELNRFFNDGFRSIGPGDALFRLVPEVATEQAFSLNALIAALSIDRQKEIDKLTPPDLEDLEVSSVALAGFYFMSILPILCGYSAAYPIAKEEDLLKDRLAQAQSLDGDYIDRMAYFFRGRSWTYGREKELLEAVLVAFCAGFGYLTPSIMAPRISIGSGVSVGLAIVAGCTTAGPLHLGTSQDVIIMFRELMQGRKDEAIDNHIDAFLDEKLSGGRKLLGFGHPFFKKDPRVIRLVELMEETGHEHEVVDLFHRVCARVAERKGIYPNLETAHGAIATSLGFDIPFLGPSIALIGRSGGMIAHLEERLNKPAFGVRNEVARNFFDKVPMGWL